MEEKTNAKEKIYWLIRQMGMLIDNKDASKVKKMTNGKSTTQFVDEYIRTIEKRNDEVHTERI